MNSSRYPGMTMREMYKHRMRSLAQKKGLQVRGLESGSWCIILPNGRMIFIQNEEEFNRFVKDY